MSQSIIRNVTDWLLPCLDIQLLRVAEVITAAVPSEFADDVQEDNIPQLQLRKANDPAPQRPTSLAADEEADSSSKGKSGVVVQPSLVKALSNVSEQRRAEVSRNKILNSFKRF